MNNNIDKASMLSKLPDGRNKDPRYATAANALREGLVPGFACLTSYVPRTTVSKDMGIQGMRFRHFMLNPNKWTIEDVFVLAGLFDTTPEKIFELMLADYARIKKESLKLKYKGEVQLRILKGTPPPPPQKQDK